MTAYPEKVWTQIGLRRWPVLAEAVTEPEEIERLLAQLISESPALAHTLLGWQAGQDYLERADFSIVIERVLIIRLKGKAK